MPANRQPAFTRLGNHGGVLITAANTSSAGDGTIGTDIFLAFTADASNGSFIQTVRWAAVATAPTTMTATVGRVYISSVTSGATTSANTFLWGEIALPNIGADNASTAGYVLEIPLGLWLKPGNTILMTNHAAPAANSNWRALVIAGDY